MSDTLSFLLDACSVSPSKITSVQWQLGSVPLTAGSPLHDQVTQSNKITFRLWRTKLCYILCCSM